MKILLFSDLHDSSRGLFAIIKYLENNREIVGAVFAGDMVNMGQPVSFVDKFISEYSRFSIPLLWIPGNNDFGPSYKVLQDHTKSLEGRIVELGGRKFTGIGGSPASWSEQYQGENALSKEEIAGTILVSHYPPNGVKYIAKNPKSKAQVTNQIQSSNIKIEDAPIAHICGHIHHTQGIGWIGQTKVIKLASSALGNTAIMDLDSLEVKFMRLI